MTTDALVTNSSDIEIMCGSAFQTHVNDFLLALNPAHLDLPTSLCRARAGLSTVLGTSIGTRLWRHVEG